MRWFLELTFKDGEVYTWSKVEIYILSSTTLPQVRLTYTLVTFKSALLKPIASLSKLS